MAMTPLEIAGNMQMMIAREQRHIANMSYAVRIGMGADAKEFKKAIRELTKDG